MMDYLAWIKRQRKKMWGKRAEKPRWRLINKLVRQRYARQNKKIIIVCDEIGKFTSQMAEAMNQINKTFKEIGEKISDQLKNI